MRTVPPGPCVYCGDPDAPSIDHVIPRRLGGTSDPENLVRACVPCNSEKGALLLDEWKQVRAWRNLPWPPPPRPRRRRRRREVATGITANFTTFKPQLGTRPHYQQLADYIRGKIEDGTYAPRSRIPPESRWAWETGMSVATVRKARAVLLEEGRIYVVRGMGTFVSPAD